LIGIGQTAPGIVGDGAGHGERPIDQFVERFGAEVGRGNHRLFLAAEDPQPQIEAFLTFQFLDLAEPLRVGQRNRARQHAVGAVGAARLGFLQQIVEQIAVIVGGIEAHHFIPAKRLGLHLILSLCKA
jgi:hypothetical protein